MVPITQYYPRRNSGAWNLVGYPRLTVAGGVAEAITTKSASSFSTPDGQPCPPSHSGIVAVIARFGRSTAPVCLRVPRRMLP